MTAPELLQELRRQGVTLELTGERLRFAPKDAVPPELLSVMRDRKAELIAVLSVPRLPWQLERLLSAASSDLLPHGTVRLEHGLVTDLAAYTLSWAAAYLTGSRDEALKRLWEAHRIWQGVN